MLKTATFGWKSRCSGACRQNEQEVFLLRIRLKINTPGGTGMLRAGAIIETSESEAYLLIRNGLAISVEPQKAKPKVTRKKRKGESE